MPTREHCLLSALAEVAWADGVLKPQESRETLRCRRGRLLLAGVTVALSLVSFGQPAQGGEGNKATAKAHYEKGTRLYEIREYDKALLEYKSAYLAQPDPAFLFNIGQCHRKLGQNQEALNFFREYLKKASPDDPNRHQVEARVREIEAEATVKAEAAQTATPASTPNPAPIPTPAQTSPSTPLRGPAPEVAPHAPTPAPPIVTAPPPSATPALQPQRPRWNKPPRSAQPHSRPTRGLGCVWQESPAAQLAWLPSEPQSTTTPEREPFQTGLATRRHPRPLTIRLAGTPRLCSGCSTPSEPGRS